MNEFDALILRQIARLLTIGCVLLVVCAGILAKVAFSTHSPRPFSDYVSSDESFDVVTTQWARKGVVVTWVESDGVGGRRVLGYQY